MTAGTIDIVGSQLQYGTADRVFAKSANHRYATKSPVINDRLEKASRQRCANGN